MIGKLRSIQLAARKWREKNFEPEQMSVFRQLAGAQEELGELAHAVLKIDQSIRGDREKHMIDAADAIGDECIFLMGLCDNLELNFDECIEGAWAEVQKRDWKKNPQTGLPG